MRFLLKYKLKLILLSSVIILTFSSMYVYSRSNSSICFYVSTYGNDSSSGTKAHPFKTLEGARSAIREMMKSKTNSEDITVYLRGGNYYITKSFSLEKIDSNNKNLSVNYKSYEKEEVFFIGGYNLKTEDFQPVKDKIIIANFINKDAAKNILVTDLSKYPVNFNNAKESIINAPELFYNNSPMTLARFPNDTFLTTGKVVTKPTNPLYSFSYIGTEPLLWNKNQPIWMSGYWYYDWSDSYAKVSNIDTVNKYISFDNKLTYGIKENQRFYFFNILEELDKECEYYIDYEKKLLYFYPNTPLENSKIQLSQLTEPFIKMKDVSNITIEGIIFEDNLSTSIVIENGINNKIKNCTVRNTSQNAISINDGTNNGIENCKIYNTGTGALIINGGDRNTLTPCNNYATNNEIYNYSRIKKSYSAALRISGVGIIVSHNTIHDAPHTAIMFSGNDHLLEYNEIYNVALETDDVGAIYSGRDWTFRGNVIRYNYLHNIDNNVGNLKVSGIYLDDCMSSAEIFGNVFYKVRDPIFIAGGRDSIIKNNIIVDCKNSIKFNEGGLTNNLDQLYANLKKVPYESRIWADKYPMLKDLLKDGSPGIPNNNTIINNLVFKANEPLISSSVITHGNISNNIYYDIDPGFVNLAKMDFRLIKSSTVFKQIKDFKNIPFENIGRQP